jgi:hypothetical protein
MKLHITASIKRVAIDLPPYMTLVDGEAHIPSDKVKEFQKWINDPKNVTYLIEHRLGVVDENTGEFYFVWEEPYEYVPDFQKSIKRKEKKNTLLEKRRENRSDRKFRQKYLREDRKLDQRTEKIEEYVQQIIDKSYEAQEEFDRGEGDFKDLQDGNIEWDYDMRNAVVQSALMDVPREYRKEVEELLKQRMDGLVLQ